MVPFQVGDFPEKLAHVAGTHQSAVGTSESYANLTFEHQHQDLA